MLQATLHKKRFHIALGRIECVGFKAAAQLAAFDDHPRKDSHAHVSGNATYNTVERAEFETRRFTPAELTYDLLKPLTIGAACAKTKDGWARRRGSCSERGEAFQRAAVTRTSSSLKASETMRSG